MSENIINIDEVAKMLGVSRRKVFALVEKQKLPKPCLRDREVVLFRRADIEKVVA